MCEDASIRNDRQLLLQRERRRLGSNRAHCSSASTRSASRAGQARRRARLRFVTIGRKRRSELFPVGPRRHDPGDDQSLELHGRRARRQRRPAGPTTTQLSRRRQRHDQSHAVARRHLRQGCLYLGPLATTFDLHFGPLTLTDLVQMNTRYVVAAAALLTSFVT